MSVTTPQDPYVFGSHTADPGGVRPGGATSTAGSRTVTAIREVPADHELHVLCARVAEALPPAARTAVVLTAPPWTATTTSEISSAAVATSSRATTSVLRIEWLRREGPVRTSLESGETTVSSRLDADGRWPRFARAVPAHHAASAATVPVPLAAEVGGGVLAAYSEAEDAFDPRDLRVLTAFARVVADVVTRESLVPSAEDPETSRLLNQAVGVLVTRNCGEQQALRRLRRISASTGQPLAAVAQMIVDEARVEAHLRFVVRSPHDRVQPREERWRRDTGPRTCRSAGRSLQQGVWRSGCGHPGSYVQPIGDRGFVRPVRGRLDEERGVRVAGPGGPSERPMTAARVQVGCGPQHLQ